MENGKIMNGTTLAQGDAIVEIEETTEESSIAIG